MDCDDSWYILRSSRFYTGFHSNLALEWSTSICLSKPLMQNLVETSVLTLDSRRIALGPPGMCLIISFQNVNFRKCRLISKSFDFWWWEWGRCPFRKTKSWKIRLLASALLSVEHGKSADPSRKLWARGWLKRVNTDFTFWYEIIKHWRKPNLNFNTSHSLPVTGENRRLDVSMRASLFPAYSVVLSKIHNFRIVIENP